jgi:hypothetical protein
LNYRRILLYIGLGAGVIVVSLIISVLLFKDRIVRSFLIEANKQINTPIKVAEIEVSIFTHFPNLSIELKNVYVEDSHPDNYPLLTASSISFQFHPLEAYRGIYNIKGLAIRDAEASLKIDVNGRNNYTILKPSEGVAASSVALELKDVDLNNIKVIYIDLKARQHYIFRSRALEASIATANDIYNIDANGELTTELISVEGKSYFEGKTFQAESELVYDDLRKIINIKPSSLTLKNARFSVEGSYAWKGTETINLRVTGKETDIQTIFSLLPESVSSTFDKYQSKGDVFFSAHLEGEFSNHELPALQVDFGFTNATIFHPEYKSQIRNASMKGSFRSDNLSDARKATLLLNNVKGSLNGEPFVADFMLRDFNDPYVNCSFRGNMDAAAIVGFYPIDNVSKVSGTIAADVSFKGKVQLLKSRATAQQVSTQGNIDLKKVNFLYGKDKVPLQNLNGNLQFSNNDLALSNVTAKFGNSDFVFNGFFKNVITFMLFENQPIGIETDLKSEFLDVNELLEIGYGKSEAGPNGSTGKEDRYEFKISPNVYLNFNCDVARLVYKKFHAAGIKGDLLVKNKVAVSRQLSLQTMGGQLTLSGIVDATNAKAIDVVCSSHLDRIYLDSVFYVFENFDQEFIQDKHLKGQVTADVNMEMALDQNLRLYQETLIADINAAIRNGELNNFEPMKKLSNYLDDEGLSRMRFSDIQNEIHIEKKTVYIPQMEIRSNVTDLKISGTHTFDQHINYKLVTPLRGRKKFTDAQAEGALESDGSGQSRLFLKIVGTTDDYKVSLDTEAIKKKIITDIKREVKELKDAFRQKETQKKKELELEEDEYFDW